MTPQLIQDKSRNRFEWHQDGKVAFLSYTLPGNDEIEFTHTYVPEELAGRGIGGKLAEAALQFVQQHHLEASASCSFMAAYMQKHPMK